MLSKLRDGEPLTTREQFLLIAQLSIPAIFAQLSAVIMHYIDTAMVGNLGSNEAAAIGMMSTSTWVVQGCTIATSLGFTIQIAQYIGAKENVKARNLVKQGLLCGIIIGIILTVLVILISKPLPVWLKGDPEIVGDASAYFFIFGCGITMRFLRYMSGNMIQSSGNSKLPSMLNIIMCILDVVFNFFLIYETRAVIIGGQSIIIPGAGLGVRGAAMGTVLAEVVIGFVSLYYLLFRVELLKLRREEGFVIESDRLAKAGRLATPVAFERLFANGAQIMSTRIVSGLGKIVMAGHSFALSTESICYMPVEGVSMAGSTIIGQSIGAGRKDLTRKLVYKNIFLGFVLMVFMGFVLYNGSPYMIRIMTKDPQARQFAIDALHIAAFSEPAYGVFMMCLGVLRGAGDTLVAGVICFSSMWVVRIPLMMLMASGFGIKGIWIAMTIELYVRSSLLLFRVLRIKWEEL